MGSHLGDQVVSICLEDPPAKPGWDFQVTPAIPNPILPMGCPTRTPSSPTSTPPPLSPPSLWAESGPLCAGRWADLAASAFL